MRVVKKAVAKKSVKKDVVGSISRRQEDSTSKMIQRLREEAESLSASADRLLTRLS